MTPRRPHPASLTRHRRNHLAEEADYGDLLLACAECGCSECSVYWDMEDQRAPQQPGPAHGRPTTTDRRAT